MLKIYNSFILPHLSYASPVWSPTLQKDVEALEAVQRRFTRMLKGLSQYSYCERLQILELPTLEARRRQQDLIQVYRILHGIDHVNIGPFQFVRNSHERSTRFSNSYNLVMPKSHLNVRKNFFSLRVVNDWNNLEEATKASRSLGIFKRRVNELFR